MFIWLPSLLSWHTYNIHSVIKIDKICIQTSNNNNNNHHHHRHKNWMKSHQNLLICVSIHDISFHLERKKNTENFVIRHHPVVETSTIVSSFHSIDKVFYWRMNTTCIEINTHISKCCRIDCQRAWNIYSFGKVNTMS